MRTNIVLNDDLVREAMRFSRVRTKTALVEEALRVFVELRSSEERIKTYEKRLLKVQQALAGKRFRESSLDVLRADRERS
jgi:Arc/MetJ family transcription regulator